MLYNYVPYSYRIAGIFRKVKFFKNLRESEFEKIFSKILLLSQLSSCVAIEIRKDIFENDWLFSKFLKITPSNFSRYTVMQIVRGRKLSRLHALLVIRGKTFAIA